MSASSPTDNRLDLVGRDAPALAAPGPLAIGVRTLELVDPGRLDIAGAREGEPPRRYDRPLTVEVWYPAALPPGTEPRGEYAVTTVDGTTRATLTGRAVRDAPPCPQAGPCPLVIVSHGYPGNRFLLAHFGENLATKGYLVVSIDHTDSTYSDLATFASTLLNRPLDQLFVLDEIARRGAAPGGFLAGLVDPERAALIGYSMGGYGVLNAIGAGFSRASAGFDQAPPGGALAPRQAGHPGYPARPDPRIRAAIAINPWGMNAGFWDAAGLAGITVPVFLMAGSADEISGYEHGTRAIFAGAVNAERYLLTFVGAGHNAAAPIPPPREVLANGTADHYADPVWDSVAMNNIGQHFATAFLGVHLGVAPTLAPYLDLGEHGNAGVWSVDARGRPTGAHSHWRGFRYRTAAGLRLERRMPVR